MRRPLNRTQSILLVLCWAVLCFIVLTSVPRIDGPLIVTILLSAALVFIPVIKSLNSRKEKRP